MGAHIRLHIYQSLSYPGRYFFWGWQPISGYTYTDLYPALEDASFEDGSPYQVTHLPIFILPWKMLLLRMAAHIRLHICRSLSCPGRGFFWGWEPISGYTFTDLYPALEEASFEDGSPYQVTHLPIFILPWKRLLLRWQPISGYTFTDLYPALDEASFEDRSPYQVTHLPIFSLCLENVQVNFWPVSARKTIYLILLESFPSQLSCL
jgi:hypothetical protein